MRFSLASSSHGNIEINLTAGMIIKAGQEISIRAKTLLVLKYLISHKNQIVTKQALLDEIWHDVVVQEQVLVQSIKEIRDLLGSKVIKTYPRNGYQWVVELEEISIEPTFSVHKNKWIIAVTFFALLVLSTTLFFTEYTKENQTITNNTHFTVAFLPVENAMPDDIHDWVPLAGMDYLSKRLKQQSQLLLVNKQKLLYLIEQNKGPIVNKQPLTTKLREKLNADLIVKTRLLGYPQDFQLHYTLYLPHSIERGIELADSVDKTFEQLIEKIALRFGLFTPKTTHAYQSNFSNEAFARGIEFYLHRNYQQAISFFSSALTSNNNLLAARRYLAASYINMGAIDQGINLMKENIKQAQKKKALREEIRSNLMIGVLLLNWQQDNEHLIEAEHYIQQAKTLAEQYQDPLFIAYAHEELAKIKRLQQHYAQAISLLKVALQYHQNFRGNYGQTNALIELARIASAQDNKQQADDYFAQATAIANKNGVATNKVAILLAHAEVQQKNGQNEQADKSSQQAKAIANEANSDVLKARVSAWFTDNGNYEIN
jgi:DNA-binding winged helix-turn-helix (wHTH) protein